MKVAIFGFQHISLTRLKAEKEQKLVTTTDSKEAAFLDNMRNMASKDGAEGGSKGSSPEKKKDEGSSSDSGGGHSGSGGRDGASGGKNPPTPVPLRYILAIGTLITGLLAGYGSVHWATHDTPPLRAATEKAFVEGQAKAQTEAEKTKQEEERTKQAREKRRIAETEARVKLASTPAIPPTVVTSCFSPTPGATLFWKPLRFSQGSCVSLPPPKEGGMYFWAVFDALPAHISGVAEIAIVRDTGNKTPDGNPIPEPTGERCAGECGAFLSRHLGEAVFLRQLPGQNLNINF